MQQRIFSIHISIQHIRRLLSRSYRPARKTRSPFPRSKLAASLTHGITLLSLAHVSLGNHHLRNNNKYLILMRVILLVHLMGHHRHDQGRVCPLVSPG